MGMLGVDRLEGVTLPLPRFGDVSSADLGLRFAPKRSPYGRRRGLAQAEVSGRPQLKRKENERRRSSR